MNDRYYSLDVFRGATVALMILVNNPGSWSHIYAPLEHAAWHGCTPTDLVFPFFLFAVGNAIAFVIPRLRQAGTQVFLKKILKRTLLIFAIGLFLNWSPFLKWENQLLVVKKWEEIRIMGVLQRIALCYLFASLIAYFFKIRTVIVISILILLAYWGLLVWFGNSANPFSIEGFYGTQVDLSILQSNHMYKGEGRPFDPEGLISTIPAIVQVLFGYLTGYYIRQGNKIPKLISGFLLSAFLLIIAGLLWSLAFPLNKKIWTSSYVVFTTGLALLVLSILIFVIEWKGIRGFASRFFDVFGKNPLFIFVLSGFLPRLLGLIRIKHYTDGANTPSYTSPFGWFYQYICKPLFSSLNAGSLLYALSMLIFYWAIAWMLDKKKIYIKV